MKTILVVDDNEAMRDTLACALADAGYRVSQAENGRAALDLLLASSDVELPDLVLLDMSMPVMDGRAFLQLVRGSPRLSRVPVVVLSGQVAANANADLGERASVGKHMSFDHLLVAVGQALAS